MKVQLVIGTPTFTVGQRVYCNGRLFKGLGTVKEIRAAGQGKATGDVFPQVIVKPDGYYSRNYGTRAVIRYNGDDLVNGLLLPESAAPRRPVAVAVSAEERGCGDEDPIEAAMDLLHKGLEALEKALQD